MDFCGDDILHVFFLPFPARGHILPMVEIARLMAQRGNNRIRCSVVMTAGNSSCIRGTFEDARTSGLPLHLHLMPFPSAEVGLPVGFEGTDSVPQDHDSQLRFFNGYNLLRRPFEDLIARHRPDCILSGNALFWPADCAHSLSIPHFQFCALSPFSLCVIEQLQQQHHQVRLRLPHPLVFGTDELPFFFSQYNGITRENARKSCGLVCNTFHELAPEYVDHHSKDNHTGSTIKVWCVGPVQLNRTTDSNGCWNGIKAWLDSKHPASVLYVGFGSECFFDPQQLTEIALGLDKCRHPFLWVVRGRGGGADTMTEWLPQHFHDHVRARGLIVTEWVPQVAILNHPSVGATVAHCGANSILETLAAGLPVVAWPLKFEQFINERLAVEILKVGIRVMDEEKMRIAEGPQKKEIVKGELLRAAVDRLMEGSSAGDEEVRAMRRNAKKYRELAAAAMEKGGSSYVSLGSLIEEMRFCVMGGKK